MFLQHAHEFVNAGFAECPVIADLAKTEKNLEEMRVRGLAFFVLEVEKSTLGLGSMIVISNLFSLCGSLSIHTGKHCISPVHGR